MSKINLLLTAANGNLSKQREMIEDAVKTAENYAFPRLKIDWDIDVLVTNRLYDMIIPDDGVGGRARTGDFIEFAIDEKRASEPLITEMLVHELCHSARWGKNDEWMQTLFDGVISEGIATYFEAEFVKDNTYDSAKKTVFITTVTERADAENEKILELLRDQLDNERYDYPKIFFNGDDKLPRWAGYSLGYYLVKKYLEQKGKKIEEAFADKYADFRVVLS